MAEVVIREYSDIETGQHFRRKVKVHQGDAVVDEWEYVLANQFYGEPGFTVRQGARPLASGEIAPATVSGGGNGDYIVKDLQNGRIYPVRQGDFVAQYERVSIAKLPKAVKEKLGEHELVEAET